MFHKGKAFDLFSTAFQQHRHGSGSQTLMSPYCPNLQVLRCSGYQSQINPNYSILLQEPKDATDLILRKLSVFMWYMQDLHSVVLYR